MKIYMYLDDQVHLNPRMTGIEIGIICIAAVGLFLSGSIAVNVGTTLPERLSHFTSRTIHNYRKRKYKYYQLISLNVAPIPFASICNYLSTANQNGREDYKVDTNGKQYLSMAFFGHNYNFCIPETTTDIGINNIEVLIRVGGIAEGNCDHFYIYYDSKDEYDKVINYIIAPFATQISPVNSVGSNIKD